MSGQISIAGALRRLARLRPTRIAIKCGGEAISYANLDARSNRVAQALLADGVGLGDRVVYHGRNSPEHLVVLFACAKLGAVFTPLNVRLAPAEIDAILADAAPAAVVTPDVDASFAGWASAPEALDPGYDPDPSEVVWQLYSSGTTGRAKGIQLTAGNLSACLARYPASLGLGPDAVSLVAMPMFHVGGGAWALAGNIVGATNVVLRDFDPAVLMGVLASEEITHAALVPAMVQAMLDLDGVDERDYESLRMISYGAGPMPAPLLDRALRRFHCGFSQGYGLTETTSTVVQLEPSDPLAALSGDASESVRARLRSVGRPVCGASVRVVDPESLLDLPAGEVGEIVVAGPTVMSGYWRMPEATREAIVDGWLRTGDAGHLDELGYLFLVDRLKDMIVSGGENIYPAEIEQALASHPALPWTCSSPSPPCAFSSRTSSSERRIAVLFQPSTIAPISWSAYGTSQPPWAKPLLGSSSAPPGACMTPSRVRKVWTVRRMSIAPCVAVGVATRTSNDRRRNRQTSPEEWRAGGIGRRESSKGPSRTAVSADRRHNCTLAALATDRRCILLCHQGFA
jgi:long-chain acyl-CoA synthetase